MNDNEMTRWGLAAAGIVLILSLGAWAVGGGGMFSPGDLSGAQGESLGGVRAHAELGARCAACHTAPWGDETMADRCVACHGDIGAEVGGNAGLHGALPGVSSCRSCHTEHQGSAADLTHFDAGGSAHDFFGFSLAVHRTTSSGTAFTCEDCHTREAYSFDEDQCRTCHQEAQRAFTLVHLEDWGGGCIACHDGVDRYARDSFDHGRTTFSLTGAHGDLTCLTCHEGARSAEALRVTASTCADCHQDADPHSGELGSECASCHSTTTWEGARFEHEFPLTHGSRQPSECSICHQGAPSEYGTYTCYGCHDHTEAQVQREHRGERIRNLSDCVRCHREGREGRERSEKKKSHRSERKKSERRLDFSYFDQ